MNQWILERILGYPIFRQSHMDSIEFMVFKRLITGFSMLILDIGWELAGLLDWVPPLETEISPWKDGHLDQKWWWKSRGTLIWGWRTYKFPGFHFDLLGILLAQMDIQTSKVGFDSHNSHLYHLYPLYLAIIERLTHKHWDSTKWNGFAPLKGERFHILSSISTWNDTCAFGERIGDWVALSFLQNGFSKMIRQLVLIGFRVLVGCVESGFTGFTHSRVWILWLKAAQLASHPVESSVVMGSVPFCDCAQACSEQARAKKKHLETERLQAARTLFELTDLNLDGSKALPPNMRFSHMGPQMERIQYDPLLNTSVSRGMFNIREKGSAIRFSDVWNEWMGG